MAYFQNMMQNSQPILKPDPDLSVGSLVCFYVGDRLHKGRVATVEEFNSYSRRTLAEILLDRHISLRSNNESLREKMESTTSLTLNQEASLDSKPYIIIKENNGKYAAVLERRVKPVDVLSRGNRITEAAILKKRPHRKNIRA